MGTALEGPSKGIFDRLEEALHTPSPGPELNTLINYIATLLTRVPFSLRLTEAIVDEHFRRSLSSEIKTAEGWKRFGGYLVEAGLDDTEGRRQELIRALDRAELCIELDQTSLMVIMQEQTKKLLLPLAKRHWSVWPVAPGAPDLACSDCPVALSWNTEGTPPHPPLFDSPEAILTMPLSRRTALVSRLDVHPPLRYPLDELGVAELNSATMLRAGQVYASTEEFVFVDSRGQLASSRALFR